MLAEAEEDVRASFEWYEERRVGLGWAFLSTVTKALQTIESHPRLSPKLEFSEITGEIRGFLLAKYPFTLVYELRDEQAVVIAVAHHRRRPDYWRRRLR